jgi:hypothetical protein
MLGSELKMVMRQAGTRSVGAISNGYVLGPFGSRGSP